MRYRGVCFCLQVQQEYGKFQKEVLANIYANHFAKSFFQPQGLNTNRNNKHKRTFFYFPDPFIGKKVDSLLQANKGLSFTNALKIFQVIGRYIHAYLSDYPFKYSSLSLYNRHFLQSKNNSHPFSFSNF